MSGDYKWVGSEECPVITNGWAVMNVQRDLYGKCKGKRIDDNMTNVEQVAGTLITKFVFPREGPLAKMNSTWSGPIGTSCRGVSAA